jgi:hypothetical protein
MQRNFNQRAATWNKNEFIEWNIMVQKYLAMVAILGAIAALRNAITDGYVVLPAVIVVDFACVDGT